MSWPRFSKTNRPAFGANASISSMTRGETVRLNETKRSNFPERCRRYSLISGQRST